MIKQVGVVLFASIVMFSCSGCFLLPHKTKFAIETFDVPVPLGSYPPAPGTTGTPIPRPGALVNGNMVQNTAYANAKGSQYSYGYGLTNLDGFYQANDPVVTAYWDHYASFIGGTSFPQEDCSYPGTTPIGTVTEPYPGKYFNGNVLMQDGDTFVWNCYVPPSVLPTGFAQFARMDAPPSSLTVPSNGVTLSNPELLIYDQASDGGAEVIKTLDTGTVDPSGKTATFPFPTTKDDGTPLIANLYAAALVNRNSDGSISAAGPSILSFGTAQQFDHPFGVSAQVVQYSQYSSTTADSYGDGTCVGSTQYYSSTSTNDYPVVTQFTGNNVAYNGVLVPVGANPSSIVLFNAKDDSTYQQQGPCSYSGSDTTYMGNAIVSNSGSNTVSIIDLNDQSVVATVGVGANPTAIAMSQDQSVAYVANAGEGSISSIDLSTYSQTGKTYVGSGLKAVEVADDGSIWAGGNGFVAHLNSNLQVTGSYTTGGYAVTAIKYNSAASELVATVVDGSGKLFVQEVNTAGTVNNNAYQVNAQRQVASLPSNGSTFYYSSTASRSAEPLALSSGVLSGLSAEDSWLSLSATPGGFTVTDTIDHTPYMSGSSPSPITGIAIDPSRYVAYMAVPDSNQVITVFLP